MPRLPTAIASSFADIKADYAAMQDSRFRRRRQGVSSMGGSADVHSVSEARFIQMREYVRAMDRDDFLIGPLTDRCVENQVQGGYDLEVQTGDDGLDKDLWQYFRAWRDDPALCDTAGVLSFPDMERLVARQECPPTLPPPRPASRHRVCAFSAPCVAVTASLIVPARSALARSEC